MSGSETATAIAQQENEDNYVEEYVDTQWNILIGCIVIFAVCFLAIIISISIASSRTAKSGSSKLSLWDLGNVDMNGSQCKVWMLYTITLLFMFRTIISAVETISADASLIMEILFTFGLTLTSLLTFSFPKTMSPSAGAVNF